MPLLPTVTEWRNVILQIQEHGELGGMEPPTGSFVVTKTIYRDVVDALIRLCPDNANIKREPKTWQRLEWEKIKAAAFAGPCDDNSENPPVIYSIIVSFGSEEIVAGTMTIGPSGSSMSGEQAGEVISIQVSIDGETVVSIGLVAGNFVSFLPPHTLTSGHKHFIETRLAMEGVDLELPDGI